MHAATVGCTCSPDSHVLPEEPVSHLPARTRRPDTQCLISSVIDLGWRECRTPSPTRSTVTAALLLSKMRNATAKLVHMTKLAKDLLDRLERTPCPRDLHMTETCTEHHRRLLAFAKGGHERMATDSPCTAVPRAKQLRARVIRFVVFSIVLYPCD